MKEFETNKYNIYFIHKNKHAYTILKQMSTKNVNNKKRKCSNSDSTIKKRNRRQLQPNYYQLKAVEVSSRNYHYFGRTYNSRVEERVEIDWMNKYHLGPTWRKRELRGQKKERLGTWVRLPICRRLPKKITDTQSGDTIGRSIVTGKL